MYTIGQRIKNFRESIGLSQKDLANMIGVRSSRLSNWEQGLNRPDVDTLILICKALHVSPSKILAMETEEITCNERHLIEAYRSHPDMQKAVNILLGLSKLNFCFICFICFAHTL